MTQSLNNAVFPVWQYVIDRKRQMFFVFNRRLTITIPAMLLSATHNAHIYSLSEKVPFVFHHLGESVTWVYLHTLSKCLTAPSKHPILIFLFRSEEKEIQFGLDFCDFMEL